MPWRLTDRRREFQASHKKHRRRRNGQGMATKNTRNTKIDQDGGGKGENRETETRIDQYILAREKRETTRKGGKEETLESRNWRNQDPDRPRHF